MRDQDRRPAALGKPPDHTEEFVSLRRREHRGRLVQQQDPNVGCKRLDNFEPLLERDGKCPSRCGRIERQADILTQGAHLLVQVLRLEAPPRRQGDVFRDAKGGDRSEVR